MNTHCLSLALSDKQAPSRWLNQRPTLNVHVAYVESRQEIERGAIRQPTTQVFFHSSYGKQKRDDFPSGYNRGGNMPQQDMLADKSELGQLLQPPQFNSMNFASVLRGMALLTITSDEGNSYV